MQIDDGLVEELMRATRTKSQTAKSELITLASACIKDLEIAGIYVTDTEEALSRQAIRLYCKANYGYDKDIEKFGAAYAALKDAMALSGDYAKAGETDG